MKCIEILKDDHRLILRAMAVANRMAQVFFEKKRVATSDVKSLLEFIREFADHLHHKMEEDVLFVWMKEHGFPVQGGPIACMMIEHDVGRGYVQAIEDELAKGTPEAPQSIEAVASSLIDIASHLENHIY